MNCVLVCDQSQKFKNDINGNLFKIIKTRVPQEVPCTRTRLKLIIPAPLSQLT